VPKLAVRRLGHAPAQLVRHLLEAIANAQDGQRALLHGAQHAHVRQAARAAKQVKFALLEP
jgi:hypothetical protein